MGVKWVKTDKHVYGAIYREHGGNFQVFGTCTEPDGHPNIRNGKPFMLTEWGFKNADDPIIKSEASKKSVDQKDFDYEFFIAVYINDEDF